MVEHETCKGCKWNNYPTCSGTIINDKEMNIEFMKSTFTCGVKEGLEAQIHITRIKPQKKVDELQEEIELLKNRIYILENK